MYKFNCEASSSLKACVRWRRGKTWFRCESYYKTRYVSSDTGGSLPKKQRQFINTLSAKSTFSLANLGSKAPLSCGGWKGQRCTFLETAWSINCTDSLDQRLLSVSSWVFFPCSFLSCHFNTLYKYWFLTLLTQLAAGSTDLTWKGFGQTTNGM